MRVAVVGGTGVVGSLVVGELEARGDEVRILSRRPPKELPNGASHYPVDLIDGEGLPDGVAGVDVVVDASNELKKAEAVLVEGTRRLLEAEAEAGVGHHVAISIVGCDRTPWSYYGVKVAQEEAIAAGPVPWSTLRATQFHTLLSWFFESAARWRLAPTGRIRLQPIDPAVVARRVAEVVRSEPGGRLPEIAGPRVETLTELSRAWREQTARKVLPVPAPIPGKLGRALRSDSLCNPSATADGPTFAEWLSGSGQGSGSAP
jgi:uncharacterized protein YbjT (DUF2867 family)